MTRILASTAASAIVACSVLAGPAKAQDFVVVCEPSAYTVFGTPIFDRQDCWEVPAEYAGDDDTFGYADTVAHQGPAYGDERRFGYDDGYHRQAFDDLQQDQRWSVILPDGHDAPVPSPRPVDVAVAAVDVGEMRLVSAVPVREVVSISTEPQEIPEVRKSVRTVGAAYLPDPAPDARKLSEAEPDAVNSTVASLVAYIAPLFGITAATAANTPQQQTAQSGPASDARL